MKKVIKLNESQLNTIIMKSVKRLLNEGSFDAQPDFCDIKGIKMIWHGEWADPEVKYGNKYINYYDVEDYVINLMDEEGVSKDKPFDEYCRENAEVIKAFIDENGKEEEEEDFEY